VPIVQLQEGPSREVTFIKLGKSFARRFVRPPIFGMSILLYHRIAKADFDPWNLSVLPDEFERQLRKLKSKTVLPLQEFAKLHVEKRLPRNAVAITFDDGYACNALVAAPMLKSFGYPATFFVVSDAVEHPEEFWWDQLEFIFHAPAFDYEAAVELLPSRLAKRPGVSERHNGAMLAGFLGIWELLHHVSTEERRRYLENLRGRLSVKKEIRPTHRPMTNAELKALAANPLFDIGGHTATHPNLSTLAEVEQEQEIVSCARLLEGTVGRPIRCFSYPFGQRSQATPGIVKAAGFECAVTGEYRRVETGDNRFELPRRQAVNLGARTL
jgi:peptidoglycan/xylan/chitin deacetylase (PgdA/CDA1 family)